MNNSLVKQSSNVNQVMEQVGNNNPTTSAITAKSLAEVQGKVFMAKQFPRDWTNLTARLESACGRKSLAEVAEYEFPRGTTKINGASIKLLEVVAQCYGNLYYDWKEISRDMINHKSTCIAQAWDLETNNSTSLEFEVAHYRDTKNGKNLVTSERDIYEVVAAKASSRVRSCLERVVPRDLVDQAREWCKTTLTSNIDVQDTLDKVISFFKNEYSVSLKQIETYFGMGRQGFTMNTLLSLKKLNNSFKDGIADPSDVFKTETTNSSGVQNSLVDKDDTKQEKQTKSKKEDKAAPNIFNQQQEYDEEF